MSLQRSAGGGTYVSASKLTRLLDNAANRALTILGELMQDAKLVQESAIVTGNFPGRMAAIEIANETDNGFEHGGIGIKVEIATAIPDLRNEPRPNEATGDTIGLQAHRIRDYRPHASVVDQRSEALLGIGDLQQCLDAPLRKQRQRHRWIGGQLGAKHEREL